MFLSCYTCLTYRARFQFDVDSRNKGRTETVEQKMLFNFITKLAIFNESDIKIF